MQTDEKAAPIYNIPVVSPVTRSLKSSWTAKSGSLDRSIILDSSRVHGELSVRLDCAPDRLRVKDILPVGAVAADLKGPCECMSKARWWFDGMLMSHVEFAHYIVHVSRSAFRGLSADLFLD